MIFIRQQETTLRCCVSEWVRSFYLPQIQAQYSDLVKLVHGSVLSELWVVDLRVDPGSLVVRVVNLFGLPLSLQRQCVMGHSCGRFWLSEQISHVTEVMLHKLYLVIWVGDHGRFPLSIHVLVPVVRLRGIRVRNGLCLVPVLKDSRFEVIDQSKYSVKSPFDMVSVHFTIKGTHKTAITQFNNF